MHPKVSARRAPRPKREPRGRDFTYRKPPQSGTSSLERGRSHFRRKPFGPRLWRFATASTALRKAKSAGQATNGNQERYWKSVYWGLSRYAPIPVFHNGHRHPSPSSTPVPQTHPDSRRTQPCTRGSRSGASFRRVPKRRSYGLVRVEFRRPDPFELWLLAWPSSSLPLVGDLRSIA